MNGPTGYAGSDAMTAPGPHTAASISAQRRRIFATAVRPVRTASFVCPFGSSLSDDSVVISFLVPIRSFCSLLKRRYVRTADVTTNIETWP